MYQEIVYAIIVINGKEVTIPIAVSCTPQTPKNELVRRAGNILREASNNASYTLSGIKD